MKLSSFTAIIFVAGTLVSACTTAETTAPTKVAAQSENVKIVGKTGTTRNTNEDGEEIICKREYATGSRVKFTEVCGTQQEWDLMEAANQKQLKDMTGDRAYSSE